MSTLRRPALLAIALGAAVVTAYLVAWARVGPAERAGSDFSAAYVAARLVRDGQGARIYDGATERAAHQRLLPPGVTADVPFLNPPAAVVGVLPLTGLDVGAAYSTWGLLQLLLLVAAVAVAARAAPFAPSTPTRVRAAAAATALAGAGTATMLLLGQWDGMCALGLAWGHRELRVGRPGRAGAAIGLLVGLGKPHLALGLAAFLLGRRELRATGGMLAAAAALAAVSVAVAGPGALAAFAGAALTSPSHTPAAAMLGGPGLVASWLGPGAWVLGAAVSAAALGGAAALGAASRRPGRVETALAGAAALSLLASPHLLPHDLVMLAPALVWGLAVALDGRGRGPRAAPARAGALLALWVGLGAAAYADTGNATPAPPGRLVPWVLLAAGAAALGACRRAPSRPAYGSGSAVGGVVE